MRIKKRAWIRITEAVLGILIMASVLIVLYSSTAPEKKYQDYIYTTQVKIFELISNNDTLRNETLKSNENYNSPVLIDFISSMLPANFNFTIKVCSILNKQCLAESTPQNKAIYVEDRIISSNLNYFDPKILRLFVWEK
jgi:hypothetical protein